MDKKYLRGNARAKKFENGGEVVNFSINIKDMLSGLENQGHSIEEFANDGGWVNLTITEKQKKDQWGNTHSCYLNEWKPDPDYKKPATSESPIDKGDVPF